MIALSILLIFTLSVAMGAALKAARVEYEFNRMDEYLNSKIMASNSGKYDGIFTPQPKELQVYRTRRDRIKSQS